MTDPHPNIATNLTAILADPAQTTGHVETTTTSNTVRVSTADRYVLGPELARGGMGAVYHATDTVLCREVAIKVLQEKFAPTSATAQRFFDEARITAQLQHPAIPPVHDLGTLPDGRPFLAMKLIHGQTLDALLAPEQRADTRRSPNLVAVFEQICLALAFAHARNIIHRDLKPANVMVGAFGEVQVMDWGLARETRNAERGMRSENQESDLSSIPHSEFRTPHSEDRTQFGQAVGTPAFMPPEQARGELENIDTRSDVFGLGGILCAILTGKPPYTKAGLAVLRQAGNADLTDAFNRLDASGADPELIALCKQCLNSTRDERPADAGVVAKAVGTLRAAAEERAKHAELERVKAETEARAQRRRRRLQLALAAAAALLLASGGAFAWWQDKQQTERTRDAKERADRNGEALVALLTRCESALRNNDADDAASALAEIDRRLAEGGGESLAHRVSRCRTDLVLLKELDATNQYQWTPQNNLTPNRPMQSARWRTAFAAGGLDFEQQSPAEIAGRINESPMRERLIGELDGWLTWGGYAGVREVLRELDPNPFRETVRDAIAVDDRTRVAQLASQPEALVQPPRFAAVLGGPSYVVPDRRREILEASLHTHPGNLSLLMWLGQTYPLNQKTGAAERARWFQAAVAAHPRQPAAHGQLAGALHDLGDRQGAIAACREAIRLDPSFHTARLNLAGVLTANRQYDEALEHYDVAIRQLAPLDASNAWILVGQANVLLQKGNLTAAEAACREGLRLSPRMAEGHLTLGEILRDSRKPDAATAACREALRLNQQLPGAHLILGSVLADQGKPNEALAEFAVELRIDPSNSRAHFNIASIQFHRNQHPEALASVRAAIALDPNLAEGFVLLGNIHCKAEDWYAARGAYKKAAELDPKRFGLIGLTLPAVDVAPPPREKLR